MKVCANYSSLEGQINPKVLHESARKTATSVESGTTSISACISYAPAKGKFSSLYGYRKVKMKAVVGNEILASNVKSQCKRSIGDFDSQHVSHVPSPLISKTLALPG